MSFPLGVRGTGGRNSMDVCQLVHESMLRQDGCLLGEERLDYSLPPPGGRTWEGAYADDHIVVQKLSFSQLSTDASLRDGEIVDRSAESYLRNGAKIALDKRFRSQENFIALGTQVRGRRGVVGSVLEKRHQIAVLVFEITCLRSVTVSCLDCVLGSFVHPFAHRSELKCVPPHVHVEGHPRLQSGL